MDKGLYDKHSRRVNAANAVRHLPALHIKVIRTAPEIYKDATGG